MKVCESKISVTSCKKTCETQFRCEIIRKQLKIIFQIIEPKCMQSNVFHDHKHFCNFKLILFCCLSAFIIKQINRKQKEKRNHSQFFLRNSQYLFHASFFHLRKQYNFETIFFIRFLSFIELKTEISYLFFGSIFPFFG